jgi:hypothetical protein
MSRRSHPDRGRHPQTALTGRSAARDAWAAFRAGLAKTTYGRRFLGRPIARSALPVLILLDRYQLITPVDLTGSQGVVTGILVTWRVDANKKFMACW